MVAHQFRWLINFGDSLVSDCLSSMNLKTNFASTTNDLASTSRSSACYLLLDDNGSPPSNSRDVKHFKRNREIQEDVYYKKLAFNHNISAHYHKLCSEACSHRLQMKHGIADMALLQEVLQFVDGRINEMHAVFLPQAPLIPRKMPTRLSKEEISPDPNDTNTRSSLRSKTNIKRDKESRTVGNPASNTPKRSLYRTEASPVRSTPATPFDLLLEHKDIAIPDSPQTPTRKPGLTKIRSEGTPKVVANTSDILKSKKFTSTTVIIISDDEDESVPAMDPVKDMPDLLKELNRFRRKLSTSLGRLPEEIIPLRTLKQLSMQPPSDYKMYQRILADTSGIPHSDIEEREAYVAEKWKESGSKFFALCTQSRRKQED
ncbi:hypothetical protein C8J55DRAFT_64133 [Lentinula edodes]|uniref:Uncharacterized protein n=1 Tax=Lentinula lateritia TaxID=40482 RepID=A0A9W9DQ85_9AGAR|nr:hypothetical protein C8J55DRAFT_64133 [Lentinula edodes]